MKRVLLDCDGVLADFIGRALKTVAYHTGRTHKPADVTEFDFCGALRLHPDEVRAVKRTISDDEGWWSSLEVLPGAIDGVRALREVAHVFVVTSPWNSCKTWLHERESWLKRHFDIPHSMVLAGSAKHLVSGDVFVDDKTATLVAWDHEQSYMQRNPDGSIHETFAVQWETPHNRLDEWHGKSTRSWPELVEWCR